MEWRVIYKTKDGNRASKTITARDREHLFSLLETHGLTIITIEQALDKKRHSAPLTKNHAVLRIVLPFFAIILALAVALSIFNLRQKRPHYDAKGETVSKALGVIKIPDKPHNRRLGEPSEILSAHDDPKTANDDAGTLSEKIVAIVSVSTNADGSIIERYQTADGKIHSKQTVPRPIFDNPSDQIIALSISGAASGGEMPPIPSLDNPDQTFKESLATDIVVNDSDSDDVKALKQDVIAVREQIRQLLDKGLSFADIISSHRELVNESAVMREEATRLVKEFLDEGDRDTAAECLEKVNNTLREIGIDQIEMPLDREEKRAIIRAQHKTK